MNSLVFQASTDGKFKELWEMEKEHIELVYQYHHRNVTRTCRSLGIGRTTLYRKLEKYGLRERKHATPHEV